MSTKNEETKSTSANSKYHAVVSTDAKLVAKYILECPAGKRMSTGGGPVRMIRNIMVTNYGEGLISADDKGSAHFAPRKMELTWDEPEKGVLVANIPGLEL
jgi:hypothetical protein